MNLTLSWRCRLLTICCCGGKPLHLNPWPSPSPPPARIHTHGTKGGGGAGRTVAQPRRASATPGLAGSRGAADQRPAIPDPGQNQRPATRDPSDPGCPARDRAPCWCPRPGTLHLATLPTLVKPRAAGQKQEKLRCDRRMGPDSLGRGGHAGTVHSTAANTTAGSPVARPGQRLRGLARRLRRFPAALLGRLIAGRPGRFAAGRLQPGFRLARAEQKLGRRARARALARFRPCVRGNSSGHFMARRRQSLSRPRPARLMMRPGGADRSSQAVAQTPAASRSRRPI